MPKTKDQKKEILNGLNDKVGRAKAMVFAKFNKLTVKDNEELRKRLRAENSEYYVAKKTLLSIALKDKNFEGLNIKDLDGQVATIFGYGDEVAPAKTMSVFKKEIEKDLKNEERISFLGGVLENRFIDQNAVKALATIPGRKELYAQLVGSINAPVSGFVNALAGNMKNLLYVLNAVKDKK